jgi:photosystem II stability/assembly factor-like uncharacterized protein
MKRILFFQLFFFLITTSFSFGQALQKPSAYEIQQAPQWAKEMYGDKPNVFVVDQLFNAYYAEHKFEKSYHTQYYKRWKRSVANNMDEQGFILPLDVQELLNRDSEYQQKLNNNSTKSNRMLPVWSPVGPYQVYNNNNTPANEQTNVYSLDQCEAVPNVLYCGTEPGEVYKSVNSGVSWDCVTLNENFNAGITAVEVDPVNPDLVFAGGGGVVKRSVDGGQTWTNVLTANNLNPNEILINTGNQQIVLVASDAGLYRSTNGGLNFTQLFNHKSFDVKLNAANNNIVYLVKDNPTLIICEFFKSTDAGATWTLQNNGWYSSTDPARYNGGARIGVTPANPNRVYAYLIGDAKANDYGYIGVYQSNDGGTSWTLPNGPAGGPYTATHLNLAYGWPTWTYHQGFYNCGIMVSATDANKILVGGLNLWRSNDGGQSFNPAAGYIGGGNLDMHVDMQDLRRVGSNYWITTDGGMYSSADFFDSTAVHKNAGIRGSDYWGFGSGWNNDVLVGGLYHNGNIIYHDNYGTGNFLSVGGGEAPTGYVNPGNNFKTYFSDIGGRFIPNTITGSIGSFSMGMSPNETYYSAESSEMEFHPDCYNVVFLGKDHKLWKSMDGGASYNLLRTFGTNAADQVKYIEIARSNPDVMYLNQQPSGGGAGTLWKTVDGGQNWSAVTIPAGNSRRMLLTLDYENENILWIAYPDVSNGAKIFKTTNGGSTWTNLSTAMLNGEYANSICCIPKTDGGIYFCSNRTVFYRNNSLADWQIVNDNLPAFFNSNIAKPFFRDGKMRIASYGKGIWESSLYDQPTGPVAKITVDKLSQSVICETDSFYFEDYSALNHQNATWQWTFTNGSPANSSLRNPAVYFANPGTYQAILVVTDSNGQTDSDTLQVNVIAVSPPTTLQEGFENGFPSPAMSIENPQNDAQWQLNTSVGGFGASPQCSFFNNFDFDAQGNWDDMRLSVNFSTPASSLLTFDVAHATYGGQYTDTLEVLASTDCGQTFSTLYKKWGSTLATAPNNSNYYTPSPTEWRNDTIDLTAYLGIQHLVIAFRNHGLWGNNIYVDNINLANTINVAEELSVSNNFEVFPNPVSACDQINIINKAKERVVLTLYNASGKVVMREIISSTTVLPLEQYNLAEGNYLLNLSGETKINNFKLLVR